MARPLLVVVFLVAAWPLVAPAWAVTPVRLTAIPLEGDVASGEFALFQPNEDHRRPLLASIRPPGGSFAVPTQLAGPGTCCAVLDANARGDAVAAWVELPSASSYEPWVTAAVHERGAAGFGPAQRLAQVTVFDGFDSRHAAAVNARGDAVVLWPGYTGRFATAFRPSGGEFAAPREVPLDVSEFGQSIPLLALDDDGRGVLVDSGSDVWTTAEPGSEWESASPVGPRLLVEGDDANNHGGAVLLFSESTGLRRKAWRAAAREPGGAFHAIAPPPLPTKADIDPTVAIGDGGDIAVGATSGRGRLLVSVYGRDNEWSPLEELAPGRSNFGGLAVDSEGAVAATYTANDRRPRVVAAYRPRGGRFASFRATPPASRLSTVYASVTMGGGKATLAWQKFSRRRITAAARDFDAQGLAPLFVFASVPFMRIGPPSACRPPGSTTIVSNRLVRVYRTRFAGTDAEAIWACMYRRGAPTRLDTQFGSNRVPSVLLPLAGTYVAFPSTECDGGCTDYITVRNLRNDEGMEIVSFGTSAIVLNARGAVAWIECSGRQGCAVKARGSGPKSRIRTLASGRRIRRRSLRLRGSRLSWIDGGDRRSARLR